VVRGALFGWERFDKLYPNARGITELSAVGFDQPRTRAMFYMRNTCGPLCAQSAFYFFEKTKGKWGPAIPMKEACVDVS
jgi:hypothetical protein